MNSQEAFFYIDNKGKLKCTMAMECASVVGFGATIFGATLLMEVDAE